MTKTTHINVSIDDSRIASLICSGFEGGSGYWLRIMDYRQPKEAPTAHLDDTEVFRHIDYPLCDGGAVICRDTVAGGNDDEYKPLVLNRDAIQRGLALMPSKTPAAFADWMKDDHDAVTGDVFLQLCLLGDVVYG